MSQTIKARLLETIGDSDLLESNQSIKSIKSLRL